MYWYVNNYIIYKVFLAGSWNCLKCVSSYQKFYRPWIWHHTLKIMSSSESAIHPGNLILVSKMLLCLASFCLRVYLNWFQVYYTNNIWRHFHSPLFVTLYWGLQLPFPVPLLQEVCHRSLNLCIIIAVLGGLFVV